MKRRDFIKSIFYTSSAASVASLPFNNASADALYGDFYARSLIDVMLLGGADLRYLFVPHPDEPTTLDYATKFWESRKSIYNTYDSVNKVTLKYNSFEDVWNGDTTQPLLRPQYDMAEYNGFKFGFHKKANWLKREFTKGNVAIVCNVYGSTNRRHDHSQLIVHTGDPTTNQFVYDRDGWGGRLAEIIGANANVVPVSTGVPPFANTTNASNRLDKVVHVKDSRNFALPKGNNNPVSQQSILGRALKSYYEKHGEFIDEKIADGELDTDWPYAKFLQHERSIRTFGDDFKNRLESVLPNPHYLFTQLSRRLTNKSFALQCRNLFECIIGADILKLRTAYMEHSSWDTHHSEKIRIEKNMYDVFGNGGGLSTLQTALRNIDGANESMVYVFTSDFGRQIKVNGSFGTDHGEGSYMILVGDAVNGGVYGEMFPQSEITPDTNNQTRFDIQGADIEGKTSFEHILGEACNWVHQGSGLSVFPALQSAAPPVESNMDPATLFNPGYRILGEVKLVNGPRHLGGVTITASNQAGVTLSRNTSGRSQYNIQGVSSNTYLVTPNKAYFTFEPTATLINVSGSDVTDVNFVATSLLHISNIFYNGLNWSDNTERLIIVSGYNFVAGLTQVTIDGVPVTRLTNVSPRYFWLYFPATVTSGEIVITTPTETYTHPVLLENM